MDRTAFRRGFLYGLAANGLTPEDLSDFAMTKTAEGGLLLDPGDMLPSGKTLAGAAYGAGEALFSVPTALYLLGGTALGGIVGGAGYALTRPDYDKQLTDLKNDEIRKELNFQVANIKNRNAARHQALTARTGRSWLGDQPAPARPPSTF